MRAVIIGCGPAGPSRGGAHSISYAHARAIQRIGDPKQISLVAAASRSEKNREDFVSEFPGTAVYGDYQEMLAVERPDFVSICAFPPDREAMVHASLEAGAKAILVEKPFAISLGAAERMISDAEAHNARLFVHFQRRYGKPFIWAKEAILSHRIGRMIGAQIVQPGPKLLDFGPHLIDAALNLLNCPEERHPVSAFATAEPSESHYQGVPAEERMIGLVRFDDGVRLVVESGNTSVTEVPILRFDGEEGFLELRLLPVEGESSMARARFRDEAEVFVLQTEEDFHHGKIDRNLYVDRAFSAILRAVSTHAACEIDAKNVLPGLEVQLALFASNAARKPVSIPLSIKESPFVF